MSSFKTNAGHTQTMVNTAVWTMAALMVMAIIGLTPQLGYAHTQSASEEPSSFNPEEQHLRPVPIRQLQTTGVLSGVITAGDMGEPLRSVRVYIYQNDNDQWIRGRSDRTDRNGRYELTLEAGTYRVKFDPPSRGNYLSEYYNQAATVEQATDVVITQGETTTINAALKTGGIITGTVSGRQGTPLKGVRVRLYSSEVSTKSIDSTSTNATGQYRFSKLRSGSYRLKFSPPSRTDYFEKFHENAADWENATDIAITEGTTTTINTQLIAGGIITGTVSGRQGTPLKGARVWLYSSEVSTKSIKYDFTDAAGQYRFSKLRSGSYRLKFSPPFGTDYFEKFHENATDWENATDIAITEGTTTTINTQLIAGGIITGTVSGRQGTPLKGVGVRLYSSEVSTKSIGSTSTDAAGQYRFSKLRSGSYRLKFSPPFGTDYLGIFHENAPDWENATDIAITGGQTITINAKLATGGIINGIVTDQTTGNPLENVSVDLYQADEEKFIRRYGTNEEGRYAIDRLTTGNYRLKFTPPFRANYFAEFHDNAPDWENATDISVTVDQTTTINADLTRGGVMAGIVTDEKTGNPLEKVTVTLYQADKKTKVDSDRTDAVGRYAIDRLTTGSYRVEFDPPFRANYFAEFHDNAPDWERATNITVTVAQTTTLDTTLTSGGIISGTVTDSAGAPLKGVSVTVYSGTTRIDACTQKVDSRWRSITRASTDENGAYTANGLTSGNYRVGFRKDGYLSEYYDDVFDLDQSQDVAVTISESTTGINASLVEGGRISGRVTDEAGNPITNSIKINAYLYDATDDSTTYINDARPDSNGNYTISELPTGSYRVQFDSNGGYIDEYYNNKPDSSTADLVNVTVGKTTSGIDASLAEGGTITGTVTNEAGEPIDGIWVFARRYDPTDDRWSYENGDSTDSTGVYAIRRLPAGVYRVGFDGRYADEYYNDTLNFSNAEEITVTVGQTISDIDASLAEGGTITGRVAIEDEQLLECINVSARRYDSGDDDWDTIDTDWDLTLENCCETVSE